MSTGNGPVPATRSYDARSRRTRAELERAATHERVLAAARVRFLADGYTGTKMLDIAAEAGVAIASVYRSGNKAELIEMLLEQAATGRRPDQLQTFAALEPPRYPDIATEPDPDQQVRMITDRIADSLDRMGALWTVLRDAASVDTGAATTLRASLERRAAALEVGVSLLPAQRLRTNPADSVDTLWALSSPETYLMLRSLRGWSHHHYQDWLRQTLLVQLLTPATTPPRTPPTEEP
jgi:AcrR family transcriptional regulator